MGHRFWVPLQSEPGQDLVFFLACRLRFYVSKKKGVLQLVFVQVCKGSRVTAEADEKQQLKKMFCLLQRKTRGSCIVMPNVVEFKTFRQVIRKKGANHFGKQQEFKTLAQGRKHGK